MEGSWPRRDVIRKRSELEILMTQLLKSGDLFPDNSVVLVDSAMKLFQSASCYPERLSCILPNALLNVLRKAYIDLQERCGTLKSLVNRAIVK